MNATTTALINLPKRLSVEPALPATPLYPALYQINTRVWLTQFSRQLGRPATLDDIPDAELDHLAEQGFDWIWMLSVWQTGPEAQQVSRSNPEWRREFHETLADLSDDDIPGSGFAITGYTVHEQLGGDAALARLRQRLKRRGLRLMLDFVPNHMGLGHPWVEEHPEYFIQGSELDLSRAPQNYVRVKRKNRRGLSPFSESAEKTGTVPFAAGGSQRNEEDDLLLAYGRDPYFSGWPDTLQLDYANPATQEAMIGELMRIAGQCDGVRCDMAMLVLPEVFERTWGRRAPLFWPTATARVRERVPSFTFLAEVYWDLEWTMQQQGFDYAYDKRLYDRLREGHARPVREHMQAGLDYQDKLARFLENHDEPRAAATFPPGVHEAAAVVTFLAPGLRFFHQGQFEGRTKRISPHLGRSPDEPTEERAGRFYERLLAVLRRPVVRDGRWQLLECTAAWDGNWTSDCFIAFAWQLAAGERLLVAVNFAPHDSQCRLGLPFTDLAGAHWRLHDLLGDSVYDRDGDDLQARGLYVAMAPWQSSIFSLAKAT